MALSGEGSIQPTPKRIKLPDLIFPRSSQHGPSSHGVSVRLA
jgi:hypothetical protein